jgi:hypothetical protein
MDFNPRVDVSNTPGDSFIPKTVSSDGVIYLTWLERVADSGTDLQFVRSIESTTSPANIFGN